MKKKRYDINASSLYKVLQYKQWFKENKIKQYSWYYDINGNTILSFKNEEDATAFKLRWM